VTGVILASHDRRVLLRGRRWKRRGVAELIYGVADHYFGSERNIERAVVQRGEGVHTQSSS
jgi:hypothetical protein